MRKTLMAVTLAAAAFAGSAEAKTRPGAITIPFNFKVQNTEMPAGEYRIKRSGMSFATVENLATHQMVHVLRETGYDSSKRRLFFKEVGGQKVLEKVG